MELARVGWRAGPWGSQAMNDSASSSEHGLALLRTRPASQCGTNGAQRDFGDRTGVSVWAGHVLRVWRLQEYLASSYDGRSGLARWPVPSPAGVQLMPRSALAMVGATGASQKQTALTSQAPAAPAQVN